MQEKFLWEQSNTYIHFLRKGMDVEAKISVDKICHRIELLNRLEEEDLCNSCNYCKFIFSLKNGLENVGFFKVHYENNNLIITPILDGIVQK